MLKRILVVSAGLILVGCEQNPPGTTNRTLTNSNLNGAVAVPVNPSGTTRNSTAGQSTDAMGNGIQNGSGTGRDPTTGRDPGMNRDGTTGRDPGMGRDAGDNRDAMTDRDGMGARSGDRSGVSPPGVAADAATFLREAASGGLMEVNLGGVAARQAQNERVKQFGQRMVDDHGKANQELMNVARGENVDVPGEMQATHRQHVDHLSGMQGAEFDRAYMTMMIRDHVEDVRKYEDQARTATDPEVRGFAERTVPVLREHLKMARGIARGLGIPADENANRNMSSGAGG